MSDNLTREELLKAIEPRSDQLNSDDLILGPITVTITKVRSGNAEQLAIIEIEGNPPRKPYKPCKTMLRILVEVFRDDTEQWIGQRMTLYRDPGATYGGHKVGGVRISHLSGLDAPRTFVVTVSRGKTQEVTIQPLASLTPEEQQFIEAVTHDFATAATLDILQGHGKVLAGKSEPVRNVLRPVYAARQKELESRGE